MMNCGETQSRLELYVLGELPAPETAEVLAHLETCLTCQAAEEDLHLLVAEIAQSSPPAKASAEFARRLLSAVAAEIGAPRRNRRLARLAVAAGAIAATLLAAAGVWRLWQGGGESSNDGPNAPAQTAKLLWVQDGASAVPTSLADGVIVRGGRMYYLHTDQLRTIVACIDSRTGQPLWRSEIESYGHLEADDERVYCLTPSARGQVELAALDGATGRTLWRFGPPGATQPTLPCRPAIAPDGRLCWTASGSVYLLRDHDGTEVWARRIADDGPLSRPAVMDGKIYVAGGKALHCIEGDSGAEVWQKAWARGAPRLRRPLLAADDGLLYAAVDEGLGASRVTCLRPADRSAVWTRTAPRVMHILAAGEGLYLRGRRIRALDRATGKRLWSRRAVGCGPMTLVDGLICFVDSADAGRLIALSPATGKRAWELAGMRSCDAFIQVGATGYLKTSDGTLRAMSLAARSNY